MILACAQKLLRERLSTFWEGTRETTGVFLGHMGKTRQAIAYSHRIYLDDIQRTLEQDASVAQAPQFDAAFSKLRVEVSRACRLRTRTRFPA